MNYNEYLALPKGIALPNAPGLLDASAERFSQLKGGEIPELI